MASKGGFKFKDKVEHKKFGKGVVLSTSYSASGKGIYVEVEFDEAMRATPDSEPARRRKIMSTHLENFGGGIEEEDPKPTSARGNFDCDYNAEDPLFAAESGDWDDDDDEELDDEELDDEEYDDDDDDEDFDDDEAPAEPADD